MSSQAVALFQKYDPRAEYINPTISTLNDMGLMDHMFKSRMPHLGMKEHDDFANQRKLQIQHFYLPLMFLSSGFVLAMASGFAEKTSRRAS